MKYRMLVTLIVLVLVTVLGSASILAQDYQESPMMTARVEAGELPPLSERLPVNPVVVTPFDEVGTYGGEIRVGFTGDNPYWGGIYSINGWERVAEWKTDNSGVEPGIVAGWDISEDATEYTFHLREGLKWSDGQPYTTEDWRFYIEDILFNEELTPGSPGGSSNGWLPLEGSEEFQFEVMDDYTIKFTFAQPVGTLLLQLAQWQGAHFSSRPAHFLKQFHADYNENIDELVAAEDGVEDWVGLFGKYADQAVEVNIFPQNPDMLEFTSKPSLSPWVLVEEMGTGTTLRMERNPYYWKVDTEGNQLPYIDTFLGIQFQDNESRTFAMLNGDIDYMKDAPGEDRILFFDALEEGRPIQINAKMNDAGTTNTVMLNLNVGDPVLNEVFNNKDFRIGMSHAINREEIIEIVHFGQGIPSQAGPLDDSPLFSEQLAYQFTEYNVDLANEYLDMVVPERDADGYRLRPDGERLSFVISVDNSSSFTSTYTQVGELVAAYWQAVGVDVVVNAMAAEQWSENFLDNNVQAVIWTGEGGAGLNSILDPRYLVPGEYHGLWANGTNAWRTNNPDAEVKIPLEGIFAEQRDRYENVLVQPSQELQIEAMREVIEVAADEFWVMGISRPPAGYQPYHERLANLPDVWVTGWIEGIEKIIRPEQWYLTS